MSETVRYKGRLTKEEIFENESLEEQCKRICYNKGYEEMSIWCTTYEELLSDELYEDYIILDKELYRLESNKQTYCDEFFEANYDENGDIIFHTAFYNGGCCLHEAIEESYKKVAKK